MRVERRGAPARRRMYFSLVISFWRLGRGDFFFPFSFLCLSLLLVVWEAHYDRLGRSRRKGIKYIETATAAAMALRAACSGIEIQDHTHTHAWGFSGMDDNILVPTVPAVCVRAAFRSVQH